MDNKAYTYSGEEIGHELADVPAADDGTKAGDIAVKIDDGPEGDAEKPTVVYIGLTREELLEYSDKTGWVVARWTILILLILGWFGILAGATYIMVSTPRCLPWWQTAVFYQVYPRSFKDSDNDGIGDMQGIEDKLDYFEDIGVQAVWMNPMYKTPGVDFGYDVSDYYEVDSTFGDMADFDRLLLTIKQRGMKVLLDYIPNHSSHHHAWFNESRLSVNNDYKSHYIWADPSCTGNPKDCPPNNWLSVWGGSAWEYEEDRNQFYLHQFLKEQPDLNWRNDDVKREFEEIMDFWLKKGVDGFRVSAVQHLLETEDYSKNELPNPEYEGNDTEEYNSLYHNLTKEYPGVHEIVQSWRSGEMDHYSTTGAYRFLTVEAHDSVDIVTSYYGVEREEANFPHNLNFLQIVDENGSGSGTRVKHHIDEWKEKMPEGSHPNFVLSNHDNSRIATRIGAGYARLCHVLLLTLPGSPTIYYGDELGMEDIEITQDILLDPAAKGDPAKSRDGARSPMQWTSERLAGFSNGSKTWLPVHPNYETVNVEVMEKDDQSILNLFKKLTSFRADEERVIPVGEMDYVIVNEDILSYTRAATLSGYNRYLVTMNFGRGGSTDDYFEQDDTLPIEGEVVISSHMDRNGDTVQLNKLFLQAGEALVIKI
ncbi:probable maltase [Ptychodera flava]|uniref:probable maltase n=1 Tax=Ptychodera flava TaxID=63121 RepID=UPI003969CB88